MAEILLYVEAVLQDEALGADAHAAALETLCDTLINVTNPDDLLAVFKVDYLATRLPALVSAAGADQGDVPVRAAWAIAELVDILPQWAKNFAERGAVQALRDRLLAVDNDNIELAEEKVALRMVAQLVEDCDEADVPKAMEAAPALCNILMSADKTIGESALSFLGVLASGARRKAQHKDI